MTLAIVIIMFIYSGIVVIRDPWILICLPPVSFVLSIARGETVILSVGPLKSADGLKLQQYPQIEHYCYINRHLEKVYKEIILLQTDSHVHAHTLMTS